MVNKNIKMAGDVVEKKGLPRSLGLFVVIVLVALLQLNIFPALKIIVSLLLVVYSLFGDAKRAMLVLLLVMPVASEVTFFGDFSLTITIVSVNALKYCLFNRGMNVDNNRRKKWYLLVIALMLYSLIVFALFNMYEQMLYTIKLSVYLIFIERYLMECVNEYKMNGMQIFTSVLRILGVGIVIAFACLLVSGGQISSAARFSFGDLSTTNNTGIQSSFVVIGLLLSFLLKNTKKMDYAIIVLCGFVSIFTQSRTALLMLAIAGLLFIVSIIVKGHLIQAIVTILSVVFGFVVLLQIPVINSFYNSISGRFQVEDLSNGRYEIWGDTVEEMSGNKKYLLFGAGDYYNLDFTFGKKNETIMAHNFLIETWVIYGALGTILVFVLLWLYIKEVIFKNLPGFVNKSKYLYIFAPLLALLLGLSFSHHFIGRANIVLLISSFIPISCVWLKKKNSNKELENHEK